MGGRPKAGAAYWRAWRAAHPEYRERERERHRRRPRGDRSAEYARRNEARRQAPAEPPPSHPILDEVAALLPPARAGAALRWPEELDREDALQEGVLARLEGRSPLAAIRAVFAAARAHRAVLVRLLDDPAAVDGQGYGRAEWGDE